MHRVSDRRLTLVLLILTTGFFLSACEEKGDRAQIRQLILDSVDRAERQAIGELMEPTTQAFKALPGRHDDQSVRKLLFVAFRRYGTFTIKHPAPTITLDESDDTANATLRFLIVPKGQDFPEVGDVVGDPAAWSKQVSDAFGDPYQLDLKLRKTADGWKVHRATLNGFGGRARGL